MIKERYPKHKIVVSFDNDIAGLSAMARIIKRNEDVLFFKWFDVDTKQKDINDFILANNDINMFTDENVLQNMIV